MQVFYVKGNDIKEFIGNFNDMNVNYDSFQFGIYEGFEGFSPIDIDEGKCQFILASNEDNDIIGVIKFKRYKQRNHEYLTEEDFTSKPRLNYKGIMFVDVREDYRRKGVATEMIKLFSDITDKEGDKTSVVLGKLTHLGRDAKLLDIFKQHLPNNKVKL